MSSCPKQDNILQPFYNKRCNRIFKQKKNPNIHILSLDQEKAFDKVDRDYMFKFLEKMNYRQQYIQFLKIIYQETSSQMQHNGYFSECIKLERGVTQGCPLSR